MSVAVVVYVGRKSASARAPWHDAPVRGRPVIEHLLDRLRAGLGQAARVEGEHRVRDLLEHARAVSATTLMVFPENAIFPDCDLARAMLAAHQAAAAGVTIAEDYPPGLVPEIYDVALLESLREIKPADAWDVAKQAGPSKVHRFPATGELEKLPATALVASENLRWAAEQARDWQRIDSTPARQMKEALLRRERAPAVDWTPSPLDGGARRILFCSLATLYSGAEESFAVLILGLDRRRWAPLVVVPRPSLFTEKLEQRGVAVIQPPSEMNRLTPPTLAWFERLLEVSQAAVVHVDSFAIAAPVMAAWKAGVPVVQHVRILHGRKAPEGFKFARRVIAVSEVARRDLLRSGLDPERVMMIPDGFATPPASVPDRRGVGIDDRAFVISMVARICEPKRQHALVDAMPELLRRVPRAQVLLAGETYAEQTGYRDDLRKRIAA
ncbi:MAG: glycosyltransferase family 4 protein, partial [Bryobacteraceae bacterium]